MAGGFQSLSTILDLRGAEATLLFTKVGAGGQQIVVWSQNNGVKTSLYSASSLSASGPFSVVDMGVNPPGSYAQLTINDSGTAFISDFYSNSLRQKWENGLWAPIHRMPSNVNNCSSNFAFNRNGDIVCFTGSRGQWLTYDNSRNILVQLPSNTVQGYVLGVNVDAGYQLSLSNNGIAALTMRNQYDVLPTPAAPNGDGRSVTNLWGAFLK
jgi:hypothetical protein